MRKKHTQSGYSLIELIVVVIIIAILATVAVRSLSGSADVARTEETIAEMNRLAAAIAGEPATVSSGTRTTYGYVGDVGALPPSLDALASNPGLATWKGPYIRDEFSDGATEYFRTDAWGDPYTYSGGITVRSDGGGTPLTRSIAPSVDALLNNTVSLVITDSRAVPPGPDFRDSILVVLSHPDGAGAVASRVSHPGSDGSVTYAGVPIGLHSLYIVYEPAADTIRRKVNIEQASTYYAEIRLPREGW